MSPLWSKTYVNATAPEPPSLFNGVTGCGESFFVSMIVAIARAYRSEPPPGAVLMTNSAGWVGTTAAGDAPAEPVGLGDGALAVAQAESAMRGATRSAAARIAGPDMTSHLHEQGRPA